MRKLFVKKENTEYYELYKTKTQAIETANSVVYDDKKAYCVVYKHDKMKYLCNYVQWCGLSYMNY